MKLRKMWFLLATVALMTSAACSSAPSDAKQPTATVGASDRSSAKATAGPENAGGQTSSAAPIPPTTTLPSTAAGAQGVVGSSGGTAKKLNCSALTSTQIVSVVGGDVDPGYSEPLGGCDWSLTKSSLSSADTTKSGVFTVRILPGSGSSESDWEQLEQAQDYAPLPAIDGRPAFFETDTGSVSVWDSTQVADVQIVVIDWTPDTATKAEIHADTIKLADDLFAS